MNSSTLTMAYEKYRSDFLFERISPAESFFSIFNFWGNNIKINDSKTEEEADAKALQNDFVMVGKDLNNAMKDFSKQKATKWQK